jgi:predicted kinase
MIVQLAGLPGTGKTTVAVGLRAHFGDRCLILDKDRVRAALYGPDGIEYSREQDDFVVGLLHQAARHRLDRDPETVVILERTCTRTYQLDDVAMLAAVTGQRLAVIRCWCDDNVARARLDADGRTGHHPAANRTFELYRRLQRTAEPIEVAALSLCTDATADDAVALAITYLTRLGHPSEEVSR